MNKSLLFFIFLLLAFTSCSRKEAEKVEPEKKIDTMAVMITQIQKCSRLYAAEYHMRKIITHEDQKKISGSIMKQDFSVNLPIGTRKVAIPIDATLKAYIDFSKFSDNNLRKNGDKVEVILPDPQIMMTATKVDHKGVRQYVPLTRGNFSDEELTQYSTQGRTAIINDIPSLGLMETSREHAARTIIPILKGMGFKEENIKVTFRKQMTIDDIRQFITKGEPNG